MVGRTFGNFLRSNEGIMKISEFDFAGINIWLSWTNSLWLHVSFWEFLGKSSKTFGLHFASSSAINQMEVILEAPVVKAHM